MSDLSYPIGKFEWPAAVTPAERARLIAQIDMLPRQFRAAVAGLTPRQLDTPYRPGGWTVRQLIHHLPDSHMNAYIRSKLALTENQPTIKPYEQQLWAELADSRDTPVEVSLMLLDALHGRWVALLRSLDSEGFSRTVVHPEQGRHMSVDDILAYYAWHGAHHTAHITALRDRMGWNAKSHARKPKAKRRSLKAKPRKPQRK